MLRFPPADLAVVSWPAPWPHRFRLEWHYWWQAHLIDCLIDAQLRTPTMARKDRLTRIICGHRLRNVTGWTNRYFDDMAWLGLALERAERLAGVSHRRGLAALTTQLTTHWTDRDVSDDGEVITCGGLPWRKRDPFCNAPANGPAAILMARLGRVGRASAMTDWMYDVLLDQPSGLILDGIRPPTTAAAHSGDGLVRHVYSYCQGVAIGADVELSKRTVDPRYGDRAAALVQATIRRLVDEQGIITRGDGGDGGLFNGILARNLALLVTDLAPTTPARRTAITAAREVVLASADSAWQHRAEIDGLPLFGVRWNAAATVPTGESNDCSPVGTVSDGAVGSSAVAERDLSVQLGGWMLMEAAARVQAPLPFPHA